jgi:phage tail sheath protein FI
VLGAASGELIWCSITSTVANTKSQVSFTFPLVGGTDGFDPRQDKRELVNSSLSTEFIYALRTLSNTDEYDFNLLAVPGMNAGNTLNGGMAQRIIDMVADRADAFYIMDVADASINSTTGAKDATVDGVITVAKSYDTSYAATYFPWVRILDSNTQRSIWVPPSVDVIGVYAFNDKVGQQWFAPAGYNRGIMSAVEARYRLNITQRDSLYIGKVNPIATFIDSGPVVWGQKTLQTKASALDRVNVRRMLIYAKKLISSVAKYYAFEPNNAKTREALLNKVNPILETIRQNQGIENFKVVLDESVNTPDVIDRNMMIGKVYIQPTKTAEILIFEFNILRSGTTFFNQ